MDRQKSNTNPKTGPAPSPTSRTISGSNSGSKQKVISGQKKPQGRKPRKSGGLVLIIVIAAVLVGLMVAYYIWSNKLIVDRSLIMQADFSVYVPNQPPRGYEVRREQTSLGEGILTYGFDSLEANQSVIITVQSRPEGFNISQMIKGGSVNSSTTSNGVLYDLSTGESSQYLLDTNDALVYITSPDKLEASLIGSIANSLKRVN